VRNALNGGAAPFAPVDDSDDLELEFQRMVKLARVWVRRSFSRLNSPV
jgi:hypothetical protein